MEFFDEAAHITAHIYDLTVIDSKGDKGEIPERCESSGSKIILSVLVVVKLILPVVGVFHDSLY